MSKTKDGTSVVIHKSSAQICAKLTFFEEMKPINSKDVVKRRLYAIDESTYIKALSRSNISSECGTNAKEYEVVYRDVTPTTAGRLWYFAGSLVTAHLFPYSVEDNFVIQLVDAKTSRVLAEKREDIYLRYSAFQLFDSISQKREMNESVGSGNAKDAFLIEKTAQLIIENK